MLQPARDVWVEIYYGTTLPVFSEDSGLHPTRKEELTETLLKLYYYAEKMWMDFDAAGVNIDKNKHFDALQETIIAGLRQTDDSDDMVDRLRETVEHSKDVEEFLARLQMQKC